ncbi:hypothetical protein AB1Y20_016565 [Prymnesium parvum]|uniref:Glutathione transferase n=1 Tax=Prymnesium parvum TaxID=97485 RepID=A0AB34ID53_PRYPA
MRRLLYGASSSSRANKVMWIAREAAVSFTHVQTPTPLLRADPAYLALNPKGTVPTWVEEEEDGSRFVLHESNSIVAYVAQAYGGARGLFPHGARGGAEAWQWQDYGETSVQPACSPMWWGYMRGSGYPLGPGGRLVPLDRPKLQAATAKALGVFGVLERHLSDGREYMLGETLTVADATCGVHVHRLFKMVEAHPAELGEAARQLGHVRRWYDNLRRSQHYLENVVAHA